MFVGYAVFSIEIRTSELIIATVAPLTVALIVSCFFIDLLMKLNALEKEMRILATYDQLTNTLTRKEFIEKASEHKKIAQREKINTIFLMIDIDHFKKINDTYGHLVGDDVLSAFGDLLNQNKRETDLVGRFGGEEFILLLWNTDKAGAVTYAENIHNNLKKLDFQHNNIKISFTISIGISLSDVDNQSDINELIEQADKAMYAAKESGRNKTIVYK
jgi:diguanylate cyclase (GGDEF)-like protein